MPTIILTRDAAGRLCGLTDKDQKAYMRFMNRALALTPDESITFTWKEPRSAVFHRRHFAMLNALFENQEVFDNADHFRKWSEVGAGYADLVPGADGKLVAMPRSIAYDALDQVEFEPIHRAVFEFFRSERALAYLYPHLKWEQAYELVDNVLREFEQPQAERQ